MFWISLIYVAPMVLLLMQCAQVTIADNSDEFCRKSKQLDLECGAYTYTIVKPLISHLNKINNEMNEMREEIHKSESKSNEIRELKESLAANNNLNQLCKTHMKDLQDAVNLLKKSKESSDRELSAKDKTIAQLTDDLKKSKKEFSDTIVKLNNEIIGLRNAVNLIKNIKETADKEIIKRDTFITQLTNDVKQFKRDNLATVANANQQTKSHMTELREAINLLVRTNESFGKDLSEKDKTITELFDELREAKKRIPIVPTNICVSQKTGIHSMTVSACIAPFDVLCDSAIAGIGGIVIERRTNGKLDFFQDWNSYRKGFGSLTEDFFLGLEKIHRLTSSHRYTLSIQMKSFSNSIQTINYDNFKIAGEDDKYRLISLGAKTGNASMSSMLHDLNMRFTTKDSDNDIWEEGNCADYHNGGWWYKNCGYCNLHGKFFDTKVQSSKAMFWYNGESIKSFIMIIRPTIY